MPMGAAATLRRHSPSRCPKLKEQGYSFVTVSELLKAGKPVIAARCYQNNPGDMTRIARTSPRRGNHDLFSVFGRSN